jgi:hypothetical protein
MIPAWGFPGGKVVKNPQKGINIVQMNNGAIKKVVVK